MKKLFLLNCNLSPKAYMYLIVELLDTLCAGKTIYGLELSRAEDKLLLGVYLTHKVGSPIMLPEDVSVKNVVTMLIGTSATLGKPRRREVRLSEDGRSFIKRRRFTKVLSWNNYLNCPYALSNAVIKNKISLCVLLDTVEFLYGSTWLEQIIVNKNKGNCNV